MPNLDYTEVKDIIIPNNNVVLKISEDDAVLWRKLFSVKTYNKTPEYGSVTPSHTQYYDLYTTIYAIPKPNCRFLSWSDGSTS